MANKGEILFCCLLFVLVLIIGLVCGLTQSANSSNDNNKQALFKKKFEILQKPQISRSGNFQDVVYYCPQNLPKTFQQMIAIDKTTEEIISASNSFLTDDLFIHTYDEPYEQRYGMYGGLLKSYEMVRTKPIDIHIEQRTVMVSNSFTGTNSGHDLGTLLATLIYIRENKLEDVQLGIQELGFKFPRILEVLELFYTNWLILGFDTVYHFDSIDFVIVSPIFIIQKYKEPAVINLVNEIKIKSEFYMISQGSSPPKNSKIILLKQIHNTSVRTHDAFYGVKFFAEMNEKGWIILNPEFDDMRYMIWLLSQASSILVSFGAIMWTHMLFFNPNAKIIHLQIGDEKAYPPVLEMSGYSRILMETSDLDDVQNKDLIAKIEG